MEYLGGILAFVVSIFTVLAYVKSTFKDSVDLIVQPTFDSINSTLNNVNSTMSKLNIIVDSVVSKQHQYDKEMLLLQRDVTKLTTIVDNLVARQHELDTNVALTTQSLNTLHERLASIEDELGMMHRSE